MVHEAITRNEMPKHNTQHKFVGANLEMIYHILKGHQVNFAFTVIYWMTKKASTLQQTSYKVDSQKKERLPYGSILTAIFERCGINLSGLEGTPVPRNYMVHGGIFRAKQLYLTTN